MTQMNQSLMKRLTRIRLVNWQYFTNDTIVFNGATLISGYNATGKTTILDAIQLVLTTNTKKFNLAANEKGSRELKGYVRCKLGAESQRYHRSGSVPANVALEFFDEAKDSFFIMGVHMLSRSEDDNQVKTNWYCEDGKLEEFTFINDDGTPVLEKEFLHNGKNITYYSTKKDAEEEFRIRLGHLDDKFGDMIQKAIAFRPMENVKQFINDFLLPDAPVDIEGLKANIQNMKELEEVLVSCLDSKERLSKIREQYEQYLQNEKLVDSTTILLMLAKSKTLEEIIDNLQSKLRTNKAKESSLREEVTKLSVEKDDLENELVSLRSERNSNKAGLAIEEAEKQIQSLNQKINEENNKTIKFDNQITNLKNYLNVLKTVNENPISADEFKLLSSYVEHSKKIEVLEKITLFNHSKLDDFTKSFYHLESEISNCDKQLNELNSRKQELELNRFTYPNEGIEKLKEKIITEFNARNINSEVFVLCDLLEIVPEYKDWTNAVEGYLSSQKFYLVVEPQYYNIALDVYHRNNRTIHSVGIINTKAFSEDIEIDENSLAAVVSTNNMYARRFVNYILNRVTRVERVEDLEKYDIAITSDCMLYQGFVSRNLNPASYKNPYIGQNAFKVQLSNIIKSISDIKKQKAEHEEEQKAYGLITRTARECKFDILNEYIDSVNNLHDYNQRLTVKTAEIAEAKKNPELMAIEFKIEDKINERNKLTNLISNKNNEIVDIVATIKSSVEELANKEEELKTEKEKIADNMELKFNAYQDALKKFETRIKNQHSSTIFENFTRELNKYINYKTDYLDRLKSLQMEYIQKTGCDYSVGIEDINNYIEQEQKFEKVIIATNRENLEKTKKQFYEIFRADFISKMKDLIVSAKTSFTKLNKVLETLSYGEDKYEFKITYNKEKEPLYKMIMSENNMKGDNNLWTNTFDSEFKDEIENLQEKLLTSDNADDKAVKEYTDYRTYLDFDIVIKKTIKDSNGETKILTLKFSDISGEKSGGETQVPFYVAIAASFYQLYSYGNTTRLILFDEAFEKMDEIRITAMMNFLKMLNLQVILITPPDKIDIIKDNVDSVIVVNRKNNRSIATGLQY